MSKYDNIKVLTFAKGSFVKSNEMLVKHLNSFGVKNIISKTDSDLSDDFKTKHKNLFSQKRGYGYWIWKPYIILEEISKLSDDEILIYLDSTDLPDQLFFDIVLEHFRNQDVLLLNRGYKNGEWTKRDCFIMMGCDDTKYHEHIQLEAGVIGLKKTEKNISLIEEWYQYMNNENILTDLPNISGQPNLKNFKDHRHDQSILTNLSIKYGLKSVSFPNFVIKYNYHQPSIYG